MGSSTFSGSEQTLRAVFLGHELSSFYLFSLPCVRSRELPESFRLILGLGGFSMREYHEATIRTVLLNEVEKNYRCAYNQYEVCFQTGVPY